MKKVINCQNIFLIYYIIFTDMRRMYNLVIHAYEKYDAKPATR